MYSQFMMHGQKDIKLIFIVERNSNFNPYLHFAHFFSLRMKLSHEYMSLVSVIRWSSKQDDGSDYT